MGCNRGLLGLERKVKTQVREVDSESSSSSTEYMERRSSHHSGSKTSSDKLTVLDKGK